MADTAVDTGAQAPPTEQSPLEDALATLADAELDGDDDASVQAPADEDGSEPTDDAGYNHPVRDGEDESEPEDAEDGLGDEADEGGELDETEARIELPDSLKEQGYEDIVVPEGQKELFQALTSAYQSRTEREAAQAKIEQYEADLLAEADEFRLAVATNPLEVVKATFGDDLQAAHEVATLYLMQDPATWKAHVELVEKLSDRDEFAAAKRELDLNHRERVSNAQRRIKAAEAGRQHAQKIREHMTGILDQIDPTDRDFVRERLIHDVREAAKREQEKSGTDFIELAVVDSVARPWLERFGSRPSPKEPAPPKADNKQAQVDAAITRIRAKAEKRKTARRTAPSGGSAGGPARPEEGTTLDDVLAKLKSGKL